MDDKVSREDAVAFDYIIVGAGSAGCVLANRLSADPRNRVLLLEAGPEDRSPFIHMPRAAAKLYGDPKHAWHFATEATDGVPAEIMVRGKMLGGSSSINGMMYFRGQPQDYDGWEALGATGWGWAEMHRAFEAIERREDDDDGVPGAGPLGISIAPDRTPFTEAFIAAGEQMGQPRVQDLNRPEQEGVGYAVRTIWKGRRMSAARAFLKPARSRANLRVIVNALVDRVIFEDGSAAGVRATVDGVETVYRCAGEVMLSAGAIATPLILQRSGVGDGAMLRALGIDVAVDAPGVGAHLLDHRLMMVRYDMAVPHSDNAALRGLRLAGNVARYYLTHRGPMAAGYGTVGAFARVMPDARTPDIEMLLAPVVADTDVHGRFVPDRGHSFEVFGYPLRSRSEGSVCIASPDPAIPPIIRPAYLADAYDRSVTVAMHRYIRRWMTMPALRSMVGAEREPARSLETDEQILEAFRTQGQSGCHGCGTCRMGDFNDAVLDPALRVKGVGKLRVVDGSIIPAMVSANTNATIMASAWRAADLILGER